MACAGRLLLHIIVASALQHWKRRQAEAMDVTGRRLGACSTATNPSAETFSGGV